MAVGRAPRLDKVCFRFVETKMIIIVISRSIHCGEKADESVPGAVGAGAWLRSRVQ